MHCGKCHFVALQSVNTQIVREARTLPLVNLYYTVSYCFIRYIVVGSSTYILRSSQSVVRVSNSTPLVNTASVPINSLF
jgi:hypothetical protein